MCLKILAKIKHHCKGVYFAFYAIFCLRRVLIRVRVKIVVSVQIWLPQC